MRTLSLCLAAGVALALAAERAGEAAKGQRIFEPNCATCHSVSAEKKLGPGLKGLFKKRKMQNGQRPTEQNVRAKIDKGGGGMPAYKELLSEEEKAGLLAYLKTL